MCSHPLKKRKGKSEPVKFSQIQLTETGERGLLTPKKGGFPGTALKAEVVRLSDDKYLVDAGLGDTVTCMKDDLLHVPIKQSTRFQTKVGYMDLMSNDMVVNKFFLEKIFIDLVDKDSKIKEQAVARFHSLMGSTDVVAGERRLLLPRRFRQNQAWLELHKIRRTSTRRKWRNVRGIFLERIRNGYLIGVAGYVCYVPRLRRNKKKRIEKFIIETMNPKDGIVLTSNIKPRNRKN
ncbi:hypothetical protein RHMOL_RhmolMtG0006900 (mitochondrion) [Rhododendron molle]|nr:hypothetical protein RHMOL_RhmolMtG0006900 [Rhododendron molle]